MRARALALAVLGGTLLCGPAVLAVDPPNFDFYGYAAIPAGLGGPLTMRSVLTNNGVVPTPILLDFSNNQYTLVVTGTLASTSPTVQQYNPASIAIYEDPIGSGTAANYAVPGTFTDGTLILSGAFDGNLTRNIFTPNLGSFVGSIDFSAGTRLGDLPSPSDWPFGGGWSRSVSTIPAGYVEAWDGKIDLALVAVETETWDRVKSLYR